MGTIMNSAGSMAIGGNILMVSALQWIERGEGFRVGGFFSGNRRFHEHRASAGWGTVDLSMDFIVDGSR